MPRHRTAAVRLKALKSKSKTSIPKLKVDYIGQSVFKFKNGDVYVGGFKVIFPKTITRHGHGMYICEDDKTVYVGYWRKDRMYHGKIRYRNGITYIGNLKHSKYHGKGNYRVPGVGSIISNYLYNLPSAEVVLVDVNGFYWTGSVSDGGGVQLYPVNPFHNDPLWHENTSEISMTKKKGRKPAEFELQISPPKIPMRNVDIGVIRGLYYEDYLNRFL